MSNKWDAIHAASEAEIQLVRQQSALLLQKREDGFDGELKTSGSIIESFIKGLIGRHLPHGYRMCSGYIATSDTFNSKANLSQHDLIIIDARIAPLYKFGVGDIEIVPAEAVCAVFEVKRTLTKKSLKAAVDHLKNIRNIIEEYDPRRAKNSCANSFLGPALSITSAAPIYGIIALDAKEEIVEGEFSSQLADDMREFLDIVWAPSVPFLALQWWQSTINGEPVTAINGSRNYKGHQPACPRIEYNFEGADAARSYRYALFSLRTWFANTSGFLLTPEQTQRYLGIL